MMRLLQIFRLFCIVLILCFIIFCDHVSENELISNAPAWAKEVVWYQIFPERFRNGDLTNDPVLEDIKGSWPHDVESEWHLSPWTSDWYKLQPWEQNGKGFGYHVQRRRYGGDLQGVIDKLDYLTDLGVNALYFNPLFESPSLHKYDGASYHHIDNNFGPNPEFDSKIVSSETPDDPNTWQWTTADSLFFKLIDECHKRNIRVIIDGVWNHVGLNFWAFRDVKINQQKSKYKEWFTVKSWDNPETVEDEFDYQGWANVRELPEITETNEGFYPAAWEYMKSAIKKWMDPNNDGDPSDGIDGWRLDVAEQVGFPAWKKFRVYVRSINPDAYITGEVWWEDWPEKMFNAAPWLQGDMFDAVKNYRWAKLVQNFFIDKKNKISASNLNKNLKSLLNDYPSDVNYVLLNLMDSHDTDRLASNIMNPDFGYDARVNPRENSNYNVRKPNKNEIKIQKLITLFQMTYIGTPMIYYGSEAGMWGADDPDCRKPMLWPEFNYEKETFLHDGKIRQPDEVRFNQDLFNYYKKLIQIRRNNRALQLGSFETIFWDDSKDIFVFERKYHDDSMIIAVNNSNSEQLFSITLKNFTPNAVVHENVTGKDFQMENNVLNISISAKSGYIFSTNE